MLRKLVRKKVMIVKLIKHLKTITKHKYYVMKLCFRFGLYKQGLLHDLSKYSWCELSTGAKYYLGYKSPNSNERQQKGYSSAWLHHKGRNKLTSKITCFAFFIASACCALCSNK